MIGRSARGWWVVGTACLLVAGCGDDGAPPDDDAGRNSDTGTTDGGREGDAGSGTPCAGDGECDDGVHCNGVETCAEGRCAAGAAVDCDDGMACTSDTCNEEMAACQNLAPDADGDGYSDASCGGDDCDDDDAMRHPGASEVCDEGGVDEDCDPATIGDRDRDGDGHVDDVCCNGTSCGADCDDLRAGVHTGVPEVCNEIDDDCDGTVDDGIAAMLYADADRDGHGDPAVTMMACAGAAGFVALGDDCDDTTAVRHPAQLEICDGIDNDCDMMIDDGPLEVTWYPDGDGDGFGTGTDVSLSVVSCTVPSGMSLLSGDCDDTVRSINPAAAEQCNGRDDDCNGRADARDGMGGLEDDDGDQVPDAACGGPDCDDGDPLTRPGATEICDARDNDCDGMSDDGSTEIPWYIDADGDGWGSMALPSVMSCPQPMGYVYRPGDCDDGDAAVHPGQADPCNGVDDDCDARRDEDAPSRAYYPDADMDGVGNTAMARADCRRPLGYVETPGDCNDADAMRQRSLGGCIVDSDRDGYGTGGEVLLCLSTAEATAGTCPVGHVAISRGGDCDDTTATRNPGATEACNGADDDCDAMIDDGFGTSTCGTGACRRTTDNCSGGMIRACTPGAPAAEMCNGIDDDCDGTADDEPEASSACGDARTVGECRVGTCGILSCIGTARNCDMAEANGCEVETMTDPLNCGTCGHGCRAGDTCVAGRCQREVIQIVAGFDFNCALLGSGAVYCWGSNAFGQLGDGTTIQRTTAVQVTGLTDAVEIDAGYQHVCVRTTAGEVRCWGRNQYAQLARTTATTQSTTPITVTIDGTPTGAALSSVAQITSGAYYNCARLTSGSVRCWGIHSNCELGAPPASSIPFAAPVLVSGIVDAVEIDSGSSHTMVRLTSGAIWGWGYSLQSQVSGMGNICSGTSMTMTALEPRGGANVSCVRMPDATIQCKGDNSQRQLGRASGALMTTGAWAPVVGISGATRLFTGAWTTCAELADRTLMCWGRNDFGQTGDGTTSVMPRDPAVANTLVPPGVRGMALGPYHSCAILAVGRVGCWGQNSFGQLGNGSTTDSFTSLVIVSGLP